MEPQGQGALGIGGHCADPSLPGGLWRDSGFSSEQSWALLLMSGQWGRIPEVVLQLPCHGCHT
jgi:hypothetical protein